MLQKDLLQSQSFNSANYGAIFLIGLMGSGKSYWADRLEKALNIPSFHLDDEIEKSEQKTITQIFAEKEENYFRKTETRILKNFSKKNVFVLSVGGGTPCYNNNMDWMNENGTTIWIDEPLAIIEKRLQKEKLHRPLIADIADDKLPSFLSEMYKTRIPFYSKAKHHLKNDQVNESAFLKIFSLYE